MSQLETLWVALTLVCLALLGCSSGPDHSPSLGLGDGGTTKPAPIVGACDTPNQGCECETQGEVIDCGQVERVSGDYVSCSMGRRTCDDGKWGVCVGDGIATLHIPAGQRRTLGLGTGMTCPDNPCDPYCRVVVDSPTDLPLPDGGPFVTDGGLQVLPTVSNGSGTCTSMVVKPTPQDLTVTGAASGSSGLLGEYFDQFDRTVPQIPKTWVPRGTRQDPTVNFDWGKGDPGVGGVGQDQFSVRWTGSIVAPSTNPYQLCTTTDDGARLWLDDVLVIDAWRDQAAVENCAAPLTWTAGSSHKVRFEFYDSFESAEAVLSWSSPSIPKSVVPSSAFVQGGSAPVVTDAAPFQVELTPADCFPGVPKPVWTLDRLDIATIDDTGKVTMISPVAGPITVTAYLGQLSASGVLNVKVAIADNSAAPTGSVAQFDLAPAGADPGVVLYPYDQTVLPIGLRAPVVQWDPQASPASAVRVSVSYPATGASIFDWSAIMPESNPARATISTQIWKYFEQTAKGQAARLSVQRIIGGQPKLAMTRTINFSTTPVRGKIYYTQYHRNGDQNEMVADPGSEDAARPAFGTADGCPVCHTISANGKVFATSSRVGYYDNNLSSPITFSPTLGGISTVNSNGSLSPIADFVANPPRANYTGGSDDWRGFAWAPLTPDGQYALVANNFWGNTEQSLIGIDPTTRQVNTGSAMLSGGSGTGLLAQYYPSTNYTGAVWKRIDPQLNFDFGAGSPGGLIGSDYSVKRTGQIQAYFSETYKFEIVSTSSDTFDLTVDATTATGTGPTTLTTNVAMTAGALVPFELDQINSSGISNVQVYWSSPSTPRALIPQSQLYPPAAEPAHGANVTYANNSGGGGVSLIEPDIASNWGKHSPAPGIGVDNWTSTWDALVESPFTGNVQLCVDSNDGVVLSVGGTQLINSAAIYNDCAAAQSWVAGTKYSLHIVHTEVANNARLILSYKYGVTPVTEVIPTTNLYPVTPPAASSGLTVTYYDTADFDVTLPASQTNPRAFQRIDPNIDFDWLSGRPNYSIISGDDAFSARYTGQINLACAGVYEFRTDGDVDEGGRLWIDDSRVMGRWTNGPLSGAGVFTAGTHDFKFDWYTDVGGAAAHLQWKTPCAGSPGWVTIPTGSFTPNSGYTRNTGYVTDGGDNGNNTSYWVWQLPTSSAPTPVDVTGETAGNWGLAGTAMMVPSFSPDGKKLVFVDGDSAGGAGWRKGLSTLDFDQAGKLFQNRRLVTSTWPLGDALKWPAFESDSRSVIYQSTVPGDSCCRNPDWRKYGYMGPTNYYEDPGRLWSIDTQAATPTPIALTKLNSGEQATDANKSYQPTMLPVAAGGYRWVVFTSTRPYGNSVNLPNIQQDFSDTTTYATSSYTAMTNTDDIQSQLWVAAIDDSPSGSADRSHPAFWLPSQNFSATAANGYINERGFWALDACHPAGNNVAGSCDVDEDCCGGVGSMKTAACRLDTPVQNPATRHCQALPPAGHCVAASDSCGTTADCCAGLICVGAACAVPPPITGVLPQNYERIYQSDCMDGTKVVWRFLDWQTVTPVDSRLEFFAETEIDPSQFSTLPVAPNPVDADNVVKVGTVSGDPVTVWTGNAVEPLLEDKMLKSQKYLKVTVRFVPDSGFSVSPILKDWRQSYSCVPAE
ncbi:MAG: PA14 domain-containing protein [Pseudomonadota bacterium]